MVDAKPSANDALSVKGGWSPSQAHTRIEVFVIRIVQNGILRTGWRVDRHGERRVKGTRAKASSVKLIEVKDGRPIRSLIRHTVVFPAKSRGYREGGRDLPFILEVRHVESAPETVAAPGRDKVDV